MTDKPVTENSPINPWTSVFSHSSLAPATFTASNMRRRRTCYAGIWLPEGLAG